MPDIFFMCACQGEAELLAIALEIWSTSTQGIS